MKKNICAFILLGIILFSYPLAWTKNSPHNFFSFSSTATWREYPLATPEMSFQKEKWAWISSLIIKSKLPLKLTSLTLQWHGEKMSHLFASLYQKKEREASVIPIQKNLICDGTWDADKQQITFLLNEKIIAINKYHLVLSYPKKAELNIKKGKFVVINTQIKPIETKSPTQKLQLLAQTL